jgi:hypothetical protein
VIDGSVWDALARESAPGPAGYLVRRLLPDAPIDVYAALTKPGDEPALVIGVDTDSAPVRELRLPTTRGLEFRAITGGGPHGLAVVLVDGRFRELFVVLVNDLAGVAGRSSDMDDAARRVLARLRRWQQFLTQVGQEGLSLSAQLGLYGELRFLRDHLATWVRPLKAVESWSGPGGAPHDFRAGAVALECKTTLQPRPTGFEIHGERQLDELGAHELYLVHCAVDRRGSGGETLPDAVRSIREIVGEGLSGEEELDQRLMGAGYHDMHAHLYQGAHYVVLEETAYLVGPGFPRLTQDDLPPGVHHVDYRIDRSACDDHRADWEVIQAAVTGERD